jgi:hypothetical protein
MSLLDRLFRRVRRPEETTRAEPRLSPAQARAQRVELWLEVQRDPTPERAAQIVQEAQALLDYFEPGYPLHESVQEIIRMAQQRAGQA